MVTLGEKRRRKKGRQRRILGNYRESKIEISNKQGAKKSPEG